MQRRAPGSAAAHARLLLPLLLLAAGAAGATGTAGATGAAGSVVELRDDNFDDLTRTGAWFVDMYAPWCVAFLTQPAAATLRTAPARSQ